MPKVEEILVRTIAIMSCHQHSFEIVCAIILLWAGEGLDIRRMRGTVHYKKKRKSRGEFWHKFLSLQATL